MALSSRSFMLRKHLQAGDGKRPRPRFGLANPLAESADNPAGSPPEPADGSTSWASSSVVPEVVFKHS